MKNLNESQATVKIPMNQIINKEDLKIIPKKVSN